MLNKLRIQLTVIFLFGGILLIGVIGGFLFFRLDEYFRNSTDLALKYRLALELRNLQAPISPEIEEAERDYLNRVQNEGRLPTPTAITDEFEEDDSDFENTLVPVVTPQSTTMPTKKPIKPSPEYNDDEGEKEEEGEESKSGDVQQSSITYPSKLHLGKVINSKESYFFASTPEIIQKVDENGESGEVNNLKFDTELSSIFVTYIPSKGATLPISFVNSSPYPVEGEAIWAALKNGIDFRTSIAPDGVPIRYLTYDTETFGDIDIIQLGRRIDDQVRYKNELLSNITVISLILLLIIGIGSWWLAGKAVIPAQKSLDQQQAFIANASHELRTPLALIRASTELAGRNIHSKEQKSLLNDVLMDVDFLTKLVEDLLILSRLDSKKINITLTAVNLNEVFLDLQRQYKLLTLNNKAVLELPEVDCFVFSDPDRLRQLLWIFIDNALQNTPSEGTIRVSAETLNHNVVIRIADNGYGIPEDDLSHVFDRFYKSRNSSHQSRGAGLGLSIAASLVKVLRGSIKLDSKTGVGTVVQIFLPQMKNNDAYQR